MSEMASLMASVRKTAVDVTYRFPATVGITLE